MTYLRTDLTRGRSSSSFIDPISTSMALVASLLELPKTSKGLQSLALGYEIDGSASPRRKIARLDTDSDIASRSSSKGKAAVGPFKIKVIGDDTGKAQLTSLISDILMVERH